MWKLLAFLLVLVAIPTINGQNECKIKINANDKYAKVYFEYFHWTRPSHNYGSAEKIKHGDFIRFRCDKGFQKDDLIGNSYNFQCVNGLFNRTLTIDDVLCRSTYHEKTETVIVPSTQFGSRVFKCDQNGWKSIQVRAKQANGKSKLLYTVCFDSLLMKTKFVYQPKKNEVPSPDSTRSDVWGLDQFGVSTLQKVQLTEGYVSSIQKQRITKAFPEKYNPQHPYPYTFNRGHLAPYADFVSQEDRKASCLYLNIAPQWKEFNSNSWATVEREVREIVKSRPGDWEIYTGTYSSIPTTKGPLFVSPTFDKSGKYLKSYVPVPKLYWKILYNLVDKSRTKVYIGINNPELRSPAAFTDKYVICKPVPDKNGNKFRGNEFKGFVYECKLEEFLEKLRAEEKIVK